MILSKTEAFGKLSSVENVSITTVGTYSEDFIR